MLGVEARHDRFQERSGLFIDDSGMSLYSQVDFDESRQQSRDFSSMTGCMSDVRCVNVSEIWGSAVRDVWQMSFISNVDK